jgi:hypothetical protein
MQTDAAGEFGQDARALIAPMRPPRSAQAVPSAVRALAIRTLLGPSLVAPASSRHHDAATAINKTEGRSVPT